MTFPTLPSKLVPFNQGTVPAYEIGRQFDEHARFFKELVNFLRTIVRDDGVVRNGTIGPEQLKENTGFLLAKDILAGMNTLLEDIRQEAARARQASEEAKALRDQVSTFMERVSHVTDTIAVTSKIMQARVENIVSLSADISEPASTNPTGLLAPYTAIPGFYGADTLGATAVAQDYAQVSMEWAEHMPDTIPPNILAINAITGQHWSSRWWATQAAAAVGGMLYYYYLPPASVPPTTAPGGEPIPIGAVYFNINTNTMYAWDGTTWVPFNTPQKATTNTLFYTAVANQTTFPTTTNDMYGAAITLDPSGDQGIQTYLNGARLTPAVGAVAGDFRIDLPTSSIILTEGTTAGAILALDVLIPPAQIAPSHVSNIAKVKPFTPDGSTTTFPLLDTGNVQRNPASSNQLWVTVDGAPQNPGVDFTLATGNGSIIFTNAPAADSVVFIIMVY